MERRKEKKTANKIQENLSEKIGENVFHKMKKHGTQFNSQKFVKNSKKIFEPKGS